MIVRFWLVSIQGNLNLNVSPHMILVFSEFRVQIWWDGSANWIVRAYIYWF